MVDTVVQVLNAGSARSFVTDTQVPRDILSGRSTVSDLAKDLRLGVGVAEYRIFGPGLIGKSVTEQLIAARHAAFGYDPEATRAEEFARRGGTIGSPFVVWGLRLF